MERCQDDADHDDGDVRTPGQLGDGHRAGHQTGEHHDAHAQYVEHGMLIKDRDLLDVPGPIETRLLGAGGVDDPRDVTPTPESRLLLRIAQHPSVLPASVNDDLEPQRRRARPLAV